MDELRSAVNTFKTNESCLQNAENGRTYFQNLSKLIAILGKTIMINAINAR